MRSHRILVAALAVPVLVLSACSSSTKATPSSSAVVSSQAVVSSPALSSPAVSPTAGPAATTPGTTTKASTTTRSVSTPAPRPAAPVDPLTGGPVSKNPVIAVKVDNTYFDVPQFGVSDADVVFVEQVEGGLTRIIAVFHSTLPTEVGPVRSVRSTDAQLLPAFGTPGLVFSGGAGGPLADLAKTSIVDTSAMGDAYFRSDAATGTYNLHADLTKIAAEAKGLGPVRSIGFAFVARSAEVDKGRSVSAIHVVMEQGQTDFAYTGGRFVRMRDNAPVSDYQGKLEAADNVVVLDVKDTPDGTVDTNGQPSYLTQTVGSGFMTLFRDGHQVTGRWSRSAADKPFAFVGSDGKPMPFKAGRTWVMLAPQTALLTVG
jgi:hypothetical protein